MSFVFTRRVLLGVKVFYFRNSKNFQSTMALFSQTLKNLKFMKKEKNEAQDKGEKTLSYYACKNIIQVFKGAKHEKIDLSRMSR